MRLISSSVTGICSPSRNRTSRRTRSVEALSSQAAGAINLEKRRISRASLAAIASGRLSAMRLGTSSPMMSETYEMTMTTLPILIA